ncbi:MAG: hypothetical protein JO057_16760 [Chloroflexi bacterium]|nr:hypothetical protein [Chloroflexota bacterium]
MSVGVERERVSAAMREFLVWVAFRPRTYADSMEAWGSHCPRFTLWEDALDQGLIVVEPGLPESSGVCLTVQGRAAISPAR